jgi:hypothetical protein
MYQDPNNIYLIRIVHTSEDSFSALHMYQEGVINSTSAAENLLDEARTNGTSSRYWVGSDLLNLLWEADTFLYFVLDFPDSRFYIHPDQPETDPIQFFRRKPVIPPPPTHRYFDPNRSFYDGIVTTLLNQSTFRCINYLRDDFGYELKFPQRRVYGFEIRYLMRWQGGQEKLHGIDPDGQNQGPP